MTDLSFELKVSKDEAALYASTETAGPDQSTLFYYAFLASGKTAPDTATLSDLFAPSQSDIFRGAFVFVEGTPPDPQALFDELAAALTNSKAWCQPQKRDWGGPSQGAGGTRGIAQCGHGSSHSVKIAKCPKPVR